MTQTHSTRPILELVAPGFYAPLGEVTAYFSMLEYALSQAVGHLLFPSQPSRYVLGNMVGAQLSFRRRMDLVASLFRYHFPKEGAKELDSLLAACQDLEGRRNAVVHSSWVSGAKPGEVRRHKIVASRKGVKVHHEPFTTQMLDQRREDIAATTFLLKEFYEKAEKDLAASSKRERGV
jgi:hypothetical protein